VLIDAQLLAPAAEALENPCLTGIITEYSWAEGICLMMVFVLFFLEVMTARYANFGHSHDDHDAEMVESPIRNDDRTASREIEPSHDHADSGSLKGAASGGHPSSHAIGDDHLGHGREHTSNEDINDGWEATGGVLPESYVAQMTAIFILEFGVIFHSIFIGLTLAVAGDEFISLYVVLVFHQTFEGLGLGTRLATAPWPRSKRWTPYVLAIAYGVSTPLAIAIGLGVRKAYPPGSQTTLIVNGIFDSISAGILIYTGLVELMAHEFMFSPTMRKAPIRTVLAAYCQMCLGAGTL
jgi:solute carrier family 39 (zinc transporter), member 1/2/3